MSKTSSRSRTKLLGSALAAGLFCVAAFAGHGPSGTPSTGAADGPSRAPAIFELVAHSYRPGEARSPRADANCLLVNPQWGWQVNNPPSGDGTEPPKPKPDNFPDGINNCRPEYDDCSGGNGKPDTDFVLDECLMCRMGNNPKPNGKRGHVNWFPATYSGSICFHNFSYPDMDYTFSFQPDGGSGLTRWNAPAEPDSNHPGDAQCKIKDANGKVTVMHGCAPRAFHVEFDSRETVERFRTKGWADFRKLASPCKLDFKSCDKDKARSAIERRRAVVVGLVGLDSVHTVYSELHPVYGIAIDIEDKESTENGETFVESAWLIFARDDGNEGSCSFKPHPLYGPDYKPPASLKLLIPPPLGREVTGVSFAQGTEFYSNNGAEPEAAYYDQLFPSDGGAPYVSNNQGVLLTFPLTKCSDTVGSDSLCAPIIEGEVHLRWKVVPLEGRATRFPDYDTCIMPDGMERTEQKRERKPKPGRQASQLFQLLVKARAEALTMMPTKRAYLGSIPSAEPLSACGSVLDKLPDEKDRVRATRFPNGPYADIIDILKRP